MRISSDAMIGAAVTALVGLITAIATWRAGHRQGQASFVTAVHEAAHLVIQDLREEIQRVADARAHIELRHAECQAELADMRAQIERLMAGPPASY